MRWIHYFDTNCQAAVSLPHRGNIYPKTPTPNVTPVSKVDDDDDDNGGWYGAATLSFQMAKIHLKSAAR